MINKTRNLLTLTCLTLCLNSVHATQSTKSLKKLDKLCAAGRLAECDECESKDYLTCKARFIDAEMRRRLLREATSAGCSHLFSDKALDTRTREFKALSKCMFKAWRKS